MKWQKKYEKMKVKLLLKLIFHAQYFPLYALQFTLYNNLLHFLFIFSSFQWKITFSYFQDSIFIVNTR